MRRKTTLCSQGEYSPTSTAKPVSMAPSSRACYESRENWTRKRLTNCSPLPPTIWVCNFCPRRTEIHQADIWRDHLSKHVLPGDRLELAGAEHARVQEVLRKVDEECVRRAKQSRSVQSLLPELPNINREASQVDWSFRRNFQRVRLGQFIRSDTRLSLVKWDADLIYFNTGLWNSDRLQGFQNSSYSQKIQSLAVHVDLSPGSGEDSLSGLDLVKNFPSLRHLYLIASPVAVSTTPSSSPVRQWQPWVLALLKGLAEQDSMFSVCAFPVFQQKFQGLYADTTHEYGLSDFRTWCACPNEGNLVQGSAKAGQAFEDSWLGIAHALRNSGMRIQIHWIFKETQTGGSWRNKPA